ncbi:MoaD/ThiS family protein [Salinimonas lutimaris]|uniref:MoaD/ThiS family protein n=1 Tax=Salinimonas lutimaris TaxID=914153 RepID=UPI0010C0856F|nr:MoaD/ThiS family protein [Salinimonas lutimaris]
MITVKTFAQIRELTGQAEHQVVFTNPINVDELISQLSADNELWAEALSGQVLVAVNQTLCDRSQVLHKGDEVAFFPPVTGG